MRVRTRLGNALPAVVLASLLAATAAQGEQSDDLATGAPSASGIETIELAASGNVRKGVGEPAGLTVEGSDTSYFEITVERISVAASCPGRGIRVAPLLGHFVLVELSSTMSSDVERLPGGGADVFMPLVAEAFRIVGPDLQEVPRGPTDASWACFENTELVAPFVGPGESTSGFLVMDSPFESGILAYEPAGPGWEWEF